METLDKSILADRRLSFLLTLLGWGYLLGGWWVLFTWLIDWMASPLLGISPLLLSSDQQLLCVGGAIGLSSTCSLHRYWSTQYHPLALWECSFAIVFFLISETLISVLGLLVAPGSPWLLVGIALMVYSWMLLIQWYGFGRLGRKLAQ
jgi:hypothetical protein